MGGFEFITITMRIVSVWESSDMIERRQEGNM